MWMETIYFILGREHCERERKMKIYLNLKNKKLPIGRCFFNLVCYVNDWVSGQCISISIPFKPPNEDRFFKAIFYVSFGFFRGFVSLILRFSFRKSQTVEFYVLQWQVGKLSADFKVIWGKTSFQILQGVFRGFEDNDVKVPFQLTDFLAE